MAASSEFPKFRDGDVRIVISPSRTYQLHSHTLRRLSPWFRQQLDVFPGAKLTSFAKREGAAAYHFERNLHSPDQFGSFIRIKVNDSGKPQRDNFHFPSISNDYSGSGEQEVQIWDWLFGSFYNLSPKFEDHNLATVLSSCMSLIDAAETVQAIDHVREIADLALLRQDQVLWKAIAANPTAWTELAHRIQSQSIFRESIVHLVGLWPRMSEEDRAELRYDIRTLCEKKHLELDLAKQAIDLRILGHYPSFLSRSSIEKPQRTSYSTDIYMWMAVSFFRHYYAQAIAEGRGRHDKDGGWQFYNDLAKGGNAYLHHEDIQAFYQYFPMSSKACNVLEANMNVLKQDIKMFVADILVSKVHVKPEDYAPGRLTCTVIDKKELPWMLPGQDTINHSHGQMRGLAIVDDSHEFPIAKNLDSNFGLDEKPSNELTVGQASEPSGILDRNNVTFENLHFGQNMLLSDGMSRSRKRTRMNHNEDDEAHIDLTRCSNLSSIDGKDT